MKPFSVSNLNKYLLFKLPSAYFSGVRVRSISEKEAVAIVRHRWINQNPFKSMYWATQGMASELVTGLLLLQEVKNSNHKISTLIAEQKGVFSKKATGLITFRCNQIEEIKKVIQKAIDTKEGQKVILTAQGINENSEIVSTFEYTWTLKVK